MEGRTHRVGGALMAFASIGTGALFAVASVSGSAFSHFWHRWWFLALVVFFGVVAVVGLYIVLAGELSWLPPRRWTREEVQQQRRTGYLGRPGSKGNLRGSKFGSGLDTAIDNQGELNAEDSTIE